MTFGLFDLYTRRVLPHAAVGIRMRDTSLDLWLERMMSCFGDVSGKAVLDFGSGSGHKALLLALCGARVTAVELDPEALRRIEQAVRRIGVSLTIIPGGAEQLSHFAEASFDRLLLSEVLEHLPVDQVHTFRDQLARVMRPGGKLFLTTPNRAAYGPAETSREYYRRVAYGHYKHYTLAELREMFDCEPFRLRAYWFETHPLTRIRNDVFYTLARYDYAIRHNQRWPLLRAALRPFSTLAYYTWEALYPWTRRLQHRYESARAANEASGMTIMLDVERI